MRSLTIIFLLGFGFSSVSQPRTDSLLLELLSGSSYSLVKDVINQKDSFRLQIIYTEINRNRFNEPSFQNYYFNVDTNIYFNPASTVKLPLALLALEKLNELDTTGIKPLLHMTDEVNVLREDEVKGSITRKEALKNAPSHDGQFFKVPKVIKK